MGADWRDCIVTYIDLVDAKEGAALGVATERMRHLHALVGKLLAGPLLPSAAHAYVWNDAVLVLSFVDESSPSYRAAVRDVCTLKARIDSLHPSFAIVVKGQTFPPPNGPHLDPRVTVLKTSSWAMANCFVIESQLKKFKASWYVDGRVAKHLAAPDPFRKEMVALLPKNERRSIHLYKGDLLPHKADPA